MNKSKSYPSSLHDTEFNLKKSNSFDELKRIREAAPSCFMQSGTATNIESEYVSVYLNILSSFFSFINFKIGLYTFIIFI